MNPLSVAKLLLLGRGLFGFLLMFLGFAVSRGPWFVVGVPVAVIGAVRALTEFGRYLRLRDLERVLGPSPRTSANADRGGEQIQSLGQVIARLLFTIAEIDGPAAAAERVAAIRVIVEQFPEPALADAMSRWELEKLDPPAMRDVLQQVRRVLDDTNRMRVFRWCARVALADERFNADEHEVLQLIAEELGLRAEIARHLFHDVKGRIIAERTARETQGGGDSRSGSGRWGAGEPSGISSARRASALAVLELPPNASDADVRRRHRELVKRLHPDANAHRSPAEIATSTERFRAIQKAYEALITARR